MEWMLMPLKRYAEFSGRSRRKEYWMYLLGLIIVAILLGVIEGAAGLTQMIGPYGPLSALLILGTFVPSLAVGVRRLHDTDRTGWWILLPLVPEILAIAMLMTGNLAAAGMLGIAAGILAIVLLVFMVLDGTKGPNKYGPDPKGVETDKVFA
jgi:uncharacterized membrane protein YhaH (DUF805 family)